MKIMEALWEIQAANFPSNVSEIQYRMMQEMWFLGAIQCIRACNSQENAEKVRDELSTWLDGKIADGTLRESKLN